MLITFAGVIVLGAAVAGMVLIAFKALGRPAPKGAVALAAGAAMFGFVIWNDYSWYERTRAALPEEFAAAAAFTTKSPLAPWTLAVAPVDRFAAIDRGTMLRHPDQPDLRIAHVHLLTRHRPTVSSRQAFDCARARRADMPDAAALEALSAADARWTPLAGDDPLLRAACAP